ncbi:MAG: RMD1 family protein [Deltaproteobacteria bacterium]|nr:RMD1 family protein [Deltaproteobacteria bacterium]
MDEALFSNRQTISVRSFFLGERLDIRALETTRCLAESPLTIPAGDDGCAVLFRWGAVVLFNIAPVEEAAFLTHMASMVRQPFDEPEHEHAELSWEQSGKEYIDKDGVIMLSGFSVERIQVVAQILAESVVLAYYEERVAGVFDRIEPLAASLQYEGKSRYANRELLHHIGSTLLIQHKTVGRVEVGEKPEILWERSDLERLYARLEDEYELRERHVALERKLELISKTAQTLLDMLQAKRTLRVEWYIVILILVEIMLTLYDMFFR